VVDVVVDGLEVVLVDVVLDDAVVDVPAGVFGPQNCTFEMSGGWWLFPTSGNPLFEKEPMTCGGLIE
jgi:hypothetical protein